jgi:hypothetical protein
MKNQNTPLGRAGLLVIPIGIAIAFFLESFWVAIAVGAVVVAAWTAVAAGVGLLIR